MGRGTRGLGRVVSSPTGCQKCISVLSKRHRMALVEMFQAGDRVCRPMFAEFREGGRTPLNTL